MFNKIVNFCYPLFHLNFFIAGYDNIINRVRYFPLSFLSLIGSRLGDENAIRIHWISIYFFVIGQTKQTI